MTSDSFTPFDLPELPSIANRAFDVRDYGAVPDGQTLNTQAIRQAIGCCAEAGGGRVVVPAGMWLTGPVHLRSGVALHLSEGAELRFSQDPDDYLPVVFSQRGCIVCYGYSPFIYARGCRDIAITGTGVLNGQGESWWPWKKAQPGMVEMVRMVAEEVPYEQRVFGTPEAGVRPEFVQFLDCQRVLLDGPTLINSPSWTVHPIRCTDVTIRNIRVLNPEHAPNTDGIDPDACRRVLVEHCHVDTGDDGICLKSGWNEDGWRAGVACEDVLIRHCTVKHAHGGFVIGSEVSGGMSNIHVHDCRFDGTDIGVRVKTKSGRGGYIRSILAERLTMRDIRQEAILVTMRYSGNPHDKKPGDDNLPITQIEGIHIRNVQCDGAARSIRLDGLAKHPLRHITIEDADITCREPASVQNVEQLVLNGVRVNESRSV